MQVCNARVALVALSLTLLPLGLPNSIAAGPPVLAQLSSRDPSDTPGLSSRGPSDTPGVGQLESRAPSAHPRTHGRRYFKPFRHPAGDENLANSKARTELSAPTIPMVAPLAAPAPTAFGGFDGIDESSTYADPPDGALAVSASYIVEAVNDAMSVWTKTYDATTGALTGVINAINAADLNIFLGNNPNCYSAATRFFGLVSDPSLDYDATHDRFMLSMISFDQLFGVSSLCVAVTTTGDPRGTWFVYAFPIPAGFTGSVLDFPRAVIGSDGVIYISGNYFVFDFFGTPIFRNARIYAFKTADMYLGNNTTPTIVNVGRDPQTGLPADTLAPARGVGGGVAGMYFVSASNPTAPAQGALITLWKWTTPFGASSFTRRGWVTVSAYAQPPAALQPGAFPAGVTSCTQVGAQCIETNDARTLTAYWSNTNTVATVWAAHTIGCTQGVAVACVHWYQLGSLDAGNPTLVREGVVNDPATAGRSRYFPSLAVAGNGNVALAYAYSSAGEYAGVAYATISAAGQASSETVLKAGEVTLVSTRYGDYAATTVDPRDGTIWHVEEYAKNFVGFSEWGTWISAIQMAP